eukprot:m.81580 g.81580  ORF g.81580 m.81580 type:complete len:660 (-) comp12815_c0_seq5:161-2140(-)
MEEGAVSGKAALVIKGIIREIIAQCAELQVVVSEELAAFMVKSVVLDPSSGFKSDSEMTMDDVASLVQQCTNLLTDDERISTATIKMQNKFASNYTTFDIVKKNFLAMRNMRVKELEAEIVEARTGTREECELLYRKMVSYALVSSDIGSPTDIQVVRETTAALESVLPMSELSLFGTNSITQKRKKLLDLRSIVTGIRMFNKYCGKGGAGVPSYDQELPVSLKELLSQSLKTCDTQLQAASGYIQTLVNGNQDDETEKQLVAVSCNARQCFTYASTTHSDTRNLASSFADLMSKHNSILTSLRKIVESRAAVPTDVVYPMFMDLSELLDEAQVIALCCSSLKHLSDDILDLTKCQSKISVPDGTTIDTDTLAVNRIILANLEERTKEAFKLLGDDTESFPGVGHQAMKDTGILPSEEVKLAQGTFGGVDLLLPSVTQGYEDLDVHHGGLCVTSVCKETPILLPVDRRIGLVKYNGLVFGFANVNAGIEFLKNLDSTLDKIVENAKKYSELIELLQLHEEFSIGTQPRYNSATAPIKVNCEIQTDTHFVESNIVKDYESNEWELRRKAIQLANIRKKATHSVQTDLSNFKRDNATQVYKPKTNGTQTRRDAGTNVPKPVTYIKGLRGPRGPKAVKAEKVDLTLEIGGVQLEINSLLGAN